MIGTLTAKIEKITLKKMNLGDLYATLDNFTKQELNREALVLIIEIDEDSEFSVEYPDVNFEV